MVSMLTREGMMALSTCTRDIPSLTFLVTRSLRQCRSLPTDRRCWFHNCCVFHWRQYLASYLCSFGVCLLRCCVHTFLSFHHSGPAFICCFPRVPAATQHPSTPASSHSHDSEFGSSNRIKERRRYLGSSCPRRCSLSF
jgi:hypothetical protein